MIFITLLNTTTLLEFYSAFFSLITDMVINGHIIATVKVRSREWCEHHCLWEPRCRSINYQIDSTVESRERVCELSSSTKQRHSGLMKKLPGWLYGQVEVAFFLMRKTSWTHSSSQFYSKLHFLHNLSNWFLMFLSSSFAIWFYIKHRISSNYFF